MSPVSALVSLQHLKLEGFEFRRVPDGILKQLAKLTCLDIGFGWNPVDPVNAGWCWL
jgi:hypothetical protein